MSWYVGFNVVGIVIGVIAMGYCIYEIKKS